MNTRSRRGFTALELLVTMAVIAILLTVGVPAVRNYSWNLRMQAALTTLQSDLKLARGRAISHNTQTVICPAASADDCSGRSAWQEGWIVFGDLNSDHRKQVGEPLVRHADATAFLNISSADSRSFLRFYPNGSAPGSNATILFCDTRGATHAGVITVSNSGRIRSDTSGAEPAENCP
jgi:type IV fimbrial biogenesis protein FimT